MAMTSPQNSSAPQHDASIEQHPDVMALGARFDQIAPPLATKALHGLAFLAGGYAAISPWVVGFHGQSSLAVTNLIVGGAVALLAFAMTVTYERIRDWAWVAAACGAWLIVAPWVVQGMHRTTGMLVSNIIVGALIALLAVVAGLLEWRRLHRSRMAHSA